MWSANLDPSVLEQQLRHLHEIRAELEQRLRFHQLRQRHSPVASEAEEAHREEMVTVLELDRLMTRIRAAEAKLELARRGLHPPVR